MTLRRGSPTSAVVAGLRAPGGTIGMTTTNFTYTARANTILAASTTYYVVLDNGEISVSFPLTNSDSEDSGGQTGWSMADGHGRRLSDSGSAYTDYTSALMIRVNGALTTTAPGAPQNFEATAGDEEVTLSWGAPASDGGAAITEYEYRYSAGSAVAADTTWTDVTDGSDDGDSTADEIGVTISGLTNDTEYAFEVRAVNSAGEGTAAGPLTATPASSCAAPNFGTRRNIWTGALTVADFIESGASAHGFNADNGVLDDKTFTLGANNYEIRFLAHLPNEGSILLRLATNLTTLEKSVLKLHVCDVALDFSAAQHIPGVKAYLFDVRSIDSIDWSSIDSRTLYLSLPANTAATGTPTITAPDTDPTTVGTTLTATTGDIADVDGLPSTFTYQWSRVDADGTSNEEAIAGATESTYVMAADDVGKKVTVALTFTDTLGSEETRTSAVYPSSGTIVAAVAACAAPSFGTRRNIWTGSLTVEMTSAVSSGFDSDGGSLDDKTFTIGSNNYEIDGVFILTAGPSAGNIRFSLKDSDLTSAEKAALRLHVCNADYNFNAAVLTNITHSYTFSADLDWSGISSRTLYLSLPANNAATGTPTISGTATVGQMLTAVTTALADSDGLPTTFTYQWVRVDGLTETDITGATSSTYTLAGADQGKKVKVKVSFIDDLNGMETRTSDAYPATGAVAGSALPTVTVAAGGEVDEGEDAEFTLTLSAAAPAGGQSVSYSLALTNPNPVADRAHVAAANLGAKTATVGAGETTATVTVATVDVDDLVSKNSTLTLSLTAAAYELGSTAAAEVTIDDTTTATVTYSGGACSATVGEGAGSVDLGVQLDKDGRVPNQHPFHRHPGNGGRRQRLCRAGASRPLPGVPRPDADQKLHCRHRRQRAAGKR